MEPSAPDPNSSVSAQAGRFLAGGGEMAALIGAKDWARTPLGPIARWSPSLRMMVGFLLANRFPLLLWWGPEYVSIYNDAYRPILGAKHPHALGQPVRECWAEIWHVLEPLIDTPFRGGPATWMEDLPLELNRYGFIEETHFTIAYSPVPDETAPRGIGGVLATVHEITEKVVGERRVVALRDLGAHATEAKTTEDACAFATAALASHAKDAPFALLYLLEPDGKGARLAGTAGVAAGQATSPVSVSLETVANGGWPFAAAIAGEQTIVVDDLASRFAEVPLGPWSDPPHSAVVVPVPSNTAHRLAGLLVAGISPRLRFDELYRGFCELVAAQIATTIANARAYEEERRRAEALAEIDRAKTAFFSNVSHEFRTPLALTLGPLEDALAGTDLSAAERQRLELAHRNSLRLLKLVNTLLDFSRIEAGRARASYQPTDLAALTADIASNFRSACERAGLALTVECPALPEPVHIDREMWEKIVLNLLSNAFKFTFVGGISVGLRAGRGCAELVVRDTGVGIPERELPRLFERFHRIEGQKSRTYEGSGIGLALVQELVKLHGGTIVVDSEEGRGTSFAVAVPFGTAHLPADRLGAASGLASTAVRAGAFVEEALRWLPDTAEAAKVGDPAGGVALPEGVRILVADDNADMRGYLKRLLGGSRAVETAGDGNTALATIRRHRPDLVLADVMMPNCDGFGLLQAIRGDPELRELPVILLSARAGEEARIEGLAAGADDYLVKPFSARELLAAVGNCLRLARVRGEEREKLAGSRRILEMVAAGVPLAETLEALMRLIESQEPGVIAGLLTTADGVYFHPGSGPNMPAAYQQALHEAIKITPVTPPYFACCSEAAHRNEVTRVSDVAADTRHAQAWRDLMLASGLRAVRSTPVRGFDGRVLGSLALYFREPRDPDPAAPELVDMATHLAAVAIEHDRSEAALRDSEGRYRALVSASSYAVYRMSPDWGEMLSLRGADFIADTPEPSCGWLDKYVDPDDQPRVTAAIRAAIAKKSTFELEHRVRRVDGSLGWTSSRAVPLLDVQGEIVEWFGAASDITQRKQAEERQTLLLDELNHRVKNTLATVQSIASQTLRAADGDGEAREAFEGRLMALSQAHDLLTRDLWEGTMLRDLAVQELVPFATEDSGRFALEGPPVRLQPKAALALGMAFHELATNAAKYGALSNGAGQVRIAWDVVNSSKPARLRLRWIENGGPPVEKPRRRGFGSRLIERGLPHEVSGDVQLRYDPSGIVFLLAFPLDADQAQPFIWTEPR